MKLFLEELAENFAGRNDLRNLCFVFPNRRSALFFQKYLGQAAGRAIFSPALKTIEDLFTELSGLKKIDKISALAILYRCYVKVKPLREGEQVETFDEFISWGDILLGDFDDMDKYLVPVDKLLVNIKDLRDLSVDYDFLSQEQKKAIAVFCRSFNPDAGLSPDREDKKRMFSETWDILLPLYKEFGKELEQGGLGYGGSIYRKVAENLEIEPLRKYSRIVFVGLNALNKCELKLLDAIKSEGTGDFYWDFYGDMVTDRNNKSSKFISENVRRYPSLHPLRQVERDFEQNFHIIGVPSSVGETRVASDILRKLHNEHLLDEPAETAVVLPDERLLFPLLGDIPDSIGSVNVTMGYPLSASDVSGFLSAAERLNLNSREKRGAAAFYHRDVMDILDHPFFKAADSSVCAGKAASVKDELIKNNRIFVQAESLCENGEPYRIVFMPVISTKDIPLRQKELIDYFQQFLSPSEKEFLYHYRKAIERIEETSLELESLEPKTYYRLLSQYVSLISVPFEGKPLNGIQIMGPLETRTLDFKNVVMLSVGEGTFPSKNVSSSFIPYNLRVGFDLPTYEFQDSIWAYHFYRSIYRAKNIYLIYDSRTEGLHSGEESRYIKQLKYLYEVPLEESVASYNLSGENPDSTVKIEKTPELMARLKALFIEGDGRFSPSSLNKYIDCPLSFYYAYVERLKEDDQVSEEVDSGLFGSIFHKSMEIIYRPYLNLLLKKEDFERLRSSGKTLSRAVDSAFESEAKIRPDELSGRNLILKEIVLKYIDRTLAIDGGRAPITISELETGLSMKLDIPSVGNVTLYGKIDRIDSNTPSVRRIVDYKTGSVNGKDNCTDVDAVFDKDFKSRPSIAFQLYFYALLAESRRKEGESVSFDPCIYALKDIFNDLPGEYTIEADKMNHFRERLTALVASIFDPEVPFEARPESGQSFNSHCTNCNFKRICRK